MRVILLILFTIGALLNSARHAYAQFTLVNVCNITNYPRVYGMAFSGKYAYLANWDSGLFIYDISNPASPAQVNEILGPGNARSVAVSGNYAYVAIQGFGMIAYDISDPAHAYASVSFHLQSQTESMYRVAIFDQYLLMCQESLIHIRTLAPSFTSVGHISLDSQVFVSALAVSGGYLYVAESDKGLHILDFSNPANPTEIGSIPVDSDLHGAVGVAASHPYLFTANDFDGLHIYSVSNAASPAQIGYINNGDRAQAIALCGNYAWLANGTNGLYTYDISSAASPVAISHLQDGSSAQDVIAANNLTYLNCDQRVARIYRLAGPPLSLNRTNGNAVLVSWPEPTGGFRLEQNTDLTTTNWLPVTNAPATNAGQRHVTLPTSPGNRFYRLTIP